MHEFISSSLIIQKKEIDKVEEWAVQVVVTVVFSPTSWHQTTSTSEISMVI
jgi:hypothetical protein